MKKRVTLTADDKKRFKSVCKTLNPLELLTVSDFVEDNIESFSKSDLRFMRSHIGQRCERLMRNAVKNFSFDD